MKKIALSLVAALAVCSVQAQDMLRYQQPPKIITDIVDARDIPATRISADGRLMLLLDQPALPALAELSRPELKLAGLRIDPATGGPSRQSAYSGIRVKRISDGAELKFSNMPDSARLTEITWSPDQEKVAFIHQGKAGAELWVADLKSMSARKATDKPLNNIYGRTYTWTSNSNAILAKFRVKTSSFNFESSNQPEGPVVQENAGKAVAVRTYQDLLKNPQDEAAFDYYLSSQLKLVSDNGQSRDIGGPAIVRSFEYSPDGRYLLLAVIHRPYSYSVPVDLFPFTTSILDKSGRLVKNLYDAPLADNLPNGFDAVPTGPRRYGWRTDKGATLYWVEALDNGNPGQQATVRDIIYTQQAPFNQPAYKLADCYLRFHSIAWGDDKLAIVTERWFRTRSERRVFIKPSNETFRVNLFDRYYEDAYNDPGSFVTRKNEFGRDVLLTQFNSLKRLSDQDNVNIFLFSEGASPEGDRPFLMSFNIKTKLIDTLFRSAPSWYEKPVFFSNENFLIASRESVDSVTNLYRVSLPDHQYTRITSFENPYPAFASVKKQKISYTRLDGIPLGGVLYTPAGFKTGDDPLPVLIWAYPREFKTLDAAGQVKGSPHQFTRIGTESPLFWALRGYAVLDNADMPIVGESNKNPNDTFVEQVRYNAEAAINKLVKMGVGDPKRMAVGGHSYGAFMTANLLAHTNLFAAGIARSGAYNRSLTPFGFQAEERTYWQAPEIYHRMSPFSYADKIKTPILLIHGQADNNSGTFPMQSERFYSALKGHGATVRLVMLPSESHGYAARESILHTLWEMDQWLEKHVKNKK